MRIDLLLLLRYCRDPSTVQYRTVWYRRIAWLLLLWHGRSAMYSICKKVSKNCYFAVVEVTLITYSTVTLARSHSTATATRYLQYNISIYIHIQHILTPHTIHSTSLVYADNSIYSNFCILSLLQGWWDREQRHLQTQVRDLKRCHLLLQHRQPSSQTRNLRTYIQFLFLLSCNVMRDT